MRQHRGRAAAIIHALLTGLEQRQNRVHRLPEKGDIAGLGRFIAMLKVARAFRRRADAAGGIYENQPTTGAGMVTAAAVLLPVKQ